MRVAYEYGDHSEDGNVVIKYTSPSPENDITTAGQVTKLSHAVRKVDLSERYPGDGYPSFEITVNPVGTGSEINNEGTEETPSIPEEGE